MKITFINKSDKDIYISSTNNDITLYSGETACIDSEETCSFSVQVNERSHITYIAEKLGIILKRNFKIKSEYSLSVGEDATIILKSEKKKGRFMDEYERVTCLADNNRLSLLSFGVPDEKRMKTELEDAISHGDTTLKLFDVLDILRNGFTAILLLLIPFAIIWFFTDIDTAFKVCTLAFIPIFGLIIYLNRFFDKVRRRLWKSAKNAKLKNEIFKDYNSYFDNEYIETVFKK